MRFTLMLARTAFFLLCSVLHGRCGDDSIFISAKINGKPARLILDTCAPSQILWPENARRLGLKITPPETNVLITPGIVPFGKTDPCTFKWGRTDTTTRFAIVDTFLPSDSCDGVIGWNCVATNIIQIDAAKSKLTFLDRLPEQISTWIQIPLYTSSGVLGLSLRGETNQVLLIDTGDDRGLSLSPAIWRNWRAAHPAQPVTFNTPLAPGRFMIANEEAWAAGISFGPLSISGVPVTWPDAAQVVLGSKDFAACIGFSALKRLDLIVDGPGKMAYLRPKTSPPPSYQHNRLGAVFLPEQTNSDRLIARVADDSPAYRAGIRDGDQWVGLENFDVPHLWLEHKIAVQYLNGPFFQNRGTKLKFTLKRGDKTFKVTATLHDIVVPTKN